MNDKKIIRKVGEKGNMDIGIAIIPKNQELTMEDICKTFPQLKRELKQKGEL